MDQDFLYKILSLGGLYAVMFFLVYLFGRKASRTLAIRVSVGSWVVLMGVMFMFGGTLSALLFIPVAIGCLFLLGVNTDNTFLPFFQENRIYKATVVPEQVSKQLGSHFYSCAEGTITTQSGEKIAFNWWQGLTSSMTRSGNAYITTFTHYLAISFAPNVVSDAFKQVTRAKADISGLTFRQKFKRWFVLDTQRPIRIEETPDGSFIIVWQTYQDTQLYTSYLNWLKANLTGKRKEGEKPISKLSITTTGATPLQSSWQIQESSMLQHAVKSV